MILKIRSNSRDFRTLCKLTIIITTSIRSSLKCIILHWQCLHVHTFFLNSWLNYNWQTWIDSRKSKIESKNTSSISCRSTLESLHSLCNSRSKLDFVLKQAEKILEQISKKNSQLNSNFPLLMTIISWQQSIIDNRLQGSFSSANQILYCSPVAPSAF